MKLKNQFIILFLIFLNLPISVQSQKDSLYIFFSHEAGFYYDPFDVTLASSDSSYQIIFTVDGSNPNTSLSADTSSTSVTIHIDPDDQTKRGKTAGFILRASLYKIGFTSKYTVTRTYIFINKVKYQTFPGYYWPKPGGWGGTAIDYDMAADVVNDNRYKPYIERSLLYIPTISISTDLSNLFDKNTGIYVNAVQRGPEWERDCSIELINPDGSNGFQINAGIRIRGGSSRATSPKHSFRIFFNEKYGTSKLNYPLFGNEGVNVFKNIDLRCEQNYSWSKDGGDDGSHNTFIKDVYSRDCQGRMGEPYTRSRYYHLYLNGVYWGLYQTQERAEANYASSYFGDNDDDYDVVKVEPAGWPFYISLADGNLDAWTELWNICQAGFKDNENYFKLEGKDKYGNPVKNSKVLVDIDNLIDYMLMIFYTGNFDAPVSSWHNNDMPNNFYAIYDRKNKSLGFKFIAHDNEHCMFVDPVYSAGLYENRVTIPNMIIRSVNSFNPQWLHYKLTFNEEYRIRFIDRAYKYFSKGGIFSPEIAVLGFKSRANEVDTAIIAESARWGDAQISPSRTYDDDWLPEMKKMYDNYFPHRSEIVKEQLLDADLYSIYQAPFITKSGIGVYTKDSTFSSPFKILINNPNNTGDLFYTLDGTDPRMIGGQLSDKSVNGNNHIELNISNSTVFKARVKSGNAWSPLRNLNLYSSNEDYSILKITEINYYPFGEIRDTDTISSKDFEFIEFKNTGTNALNISGIQVDSAVSFTVPPNTILEPSAFYVIASKPEEFYNRYGLIPDGNYKGHLANEGELLLVNDKNGKNILSASYSGSAPWPSNIKGYSLVSNETNPGGNPNSSDYWRRSYAVNGSPFSDDNLMSSGNELVNEKPIIFPNPTKRLIFIKSKNNDDLLNSEIQLYDLFGKKLFAGIIDNKYFILNLQSLNIPYGLYLLNINGKGNIYNEKILYLPN